MQVPATIRICALMVLVSALAAATYAGDVIHSQQPAPAPGGEATPSAQPPIAPGSQLLEIPVPEVFRGCWQGTVTTLDSRTRLSSWLPLSVWLPKSYKMCFVKRGADRWQLTYSSSRADTGSLPVVQWAQALRVIRIAGPDLLYVEAKLRLIDGSIIKDETSTIRLRIEAGGTMHAEAAVIIDWDGSPWMAVTWHTVFDQVPSDLSWNRSDRLSRAGRTERLLPLAEGRP